MADGVRADRAGDVNLLLCDQRPRDRRAEKIEALVLRVRAEHREDIVADEFLAQILDEDVFGLDAEKQRLLPRGSSSSPWPRSAVKVTTSQP